MTPRNLDQRKNYHAGWKNLAMVKDDLSGQICAPVIFYPIEWGKVFWELYCLYLHHVRPRDVGHPFLLVTERKGENFGEPYSLAQYIKKHEKAVLHLTDRKAVKHEGTTTHGLRYRYAFDIKRAFDGLPDMLKMIQYCMRHRAIESQEVYTAPSMQDMMNALKDRRSDYSVPTIVTTTRHQLPR
jgi:integrase